MTNIPKLLSGNEAFALGAYHSGVKVATAYPGTPSTEILETLAQFDDIYAEWSTNEKVAMEVAIGASYAGARSIVSMKHVGLNVAIDPFIAAAMTGINAGLVVISADDPGMHSSQNEQDNRYYAKLAKVPMFEPSDGQEAYDLLSYAFDSSENFDTPVLLRSTTRISHSKSVVKHKKERILPINPTNFSYDFTKYVMLPAHARLRHPLVEERMIRLGEYCESFPLNQIIEGKNDIGIVSSGIAYQYAREVFPEASFLKLTMTYPLPDNLIRFFAAQVKRLIVIEELDSFIQEHIQALGIKVTGKDFIPRVGELNPDIVEKALQRDDLLPEKRVIKQEVKKQNLPGRPPLLCPGCPHSGIFYTLSSLGQRLTLPGKSLRQPKLIIAGDIGCYTLGAYPPLNAMDTCACMGAGIGQAQGMIKARVSEKIVAVIGDSTFFHSGITGLINAVYNKAQITIIILDNRTTAMTGHQKHPGTAITAQGLGTKAVDLESLAHGIGVEEVENVNAWDLKQLKDSLIRSLTNPELSVIIIRGNCPVSEPKHSNPQIIDTNICNQCYLCLMIGCPAIRKNHDQVYIDTSLCIGDNCTLCQQLCPQKAISSKDNISGKQNEPI